MVWFWHLSIVKFCIYPYVGSPDAPLGTELPKNTHVLAEGALGDQGAWSLYFLISAPVSS